MQDTKKAQSLINHVGWEIEKMRAGMAKIIAYKDMYVAQGVDPTGTPLDGNEAVLLSKVTDLNTELQRPVFDVLIAAIVPSHRGTALDVEA